MRERHFSTSVESLAPIQFHLNMRLELLQ